MNDSAAGRLIGALVAPVKTFESIAQRPTWVLAMIVMLLATLGVGYLTMQHTDMAGNMRQAIEKQANGSMTPEQIDDRVAMATKVTHITSIAGPFVFVPVSFLLIGLVFWIGLRLVGSEMRYLVSFSICLHALLPSLVLGLISIPVLLGRGIMSVDELRRGVVASSAAAFAPEDASPVVVSLLSSLDLFSFWCLALLIVGYRAGSKLKTGTVTAVVLSIWVLYVLGKTGIASFTPH
jgi:hypothetical protein